MLKVAYVATHLESYLAEESGVFARSIAGLEQLSESLSFDLALVETHLTTRQDARRVAEKCIDQAIDFVLLQNASFTMGDLMLEFVDRPFKLGIWATEEASRAGAIPLNNFVSMNLQAGIATRYLKGRNPAVKWFYGYPEHPWFRTRLEPTLAALSAIKRLSRAKVGLIGGLAPTFYNVQFDERSLGQTVGTEVGHHELAELFALVYQQPESAIQQAATAMREAASNHSEITERDLKTSAGIYLALKEFATTNGYDALAVSDWPAFQSELKIHPGMAFSYLDEFNLIPVASEGDVLGAVSMLMLNELNDDKSLLLDMNDLDLERDAVLMWHCGGSPLSFADDNGVTWRNHSTLGRKSAAPPMGAVADYTFAKGSATILRLSDDAKKLFVLGAEVINSPYAGFDGSRGWLSNFRWGAKPLGLADVVNTIMVEGIEHHFVLGKGNHSEAAFEVAAWLDLTMIEPIPYKPYLQRFSRQ